MSINVGKIENEIKALLDEQGKRKENDNGESLARGLAKIIADAILTVDVKITGVTTAGSASAQIQNNTATGEIS